MTRSKHDFYQHSSLSQQLSFRDASFRDYAGSDRHTSEQLAALKVLSRFGLVHPKDPLVILMWAYLTEKRKALFATSERTNEITKLGLMTPKGEDVYSGSSEVP